MKNFIMALGLVAALGANAAVIDIKGGKPDGTFTLGEFKVEDAGIIGRKSEPLSHINGKFDAKGTATLDVKADGPRVYALAVYEAMAHQPLLFVNPDDKVTLTYSADNPYPAVEGPELTRQVAVAQQAFDRMLADFQTKAQNPELSNEQKEKAYNGLIAGLDSLVEANKSNPGSVYLLKKLPAEMVAAHVKNIEPKAYNNMLSKLYEDACTAARSYEARQEAKAKVQPGKPAPDFTLNNLEGKPVSLSSLRGKYVIIDFWGSWCGWCIKGMPALKEFYQANKDKVEVVGVDCGDTDERWRAAVAKHELPWVNVRQTEADKVTEAYAIEGFPTKFLIGPDGNILNVTVGEDPNFFPTITSLIK